MKRRLCSISLTAALVLTACSGGEAAEQAEAPSAASANSAPRSVGAAGQVATATTTMPPPSTTTTTTIAPLAPNTLAFASAEDIGRVFTVDLDITAATAPGGEPDAGIIAAGAVVQTSSMRSADGVLWVRLESTNAESSTLGWLPADVLTPATESVFTQDAAAAREFRRVSLAVENDALGLFANPGVGSPIGSIPEGSVALHGGTSALAPSGDTWLDVIDPDTGERLGWVLGRSFNQFIGGVIQDEDGLSLSRTPLSGVSYGQSLNGAADAGCNAVQVTFSNSSSTAGIGVVFATSPPVGRQLNSGLYDWSGTSVFSGAGADVVVTVPSDAASTWFFASLNDESQADFASLNADGLAVASSVFEVQVPAGSCIFAPPVSEGDLASEGFVEFEEVEVVAEGEDGEGEEPADGDESLLTDEAAVESDPSSDAETGPLEEEATG